MKKHLKKIAIICSMAFAINILPTESIMAEERVINYELQDTEDLIKESVEGEEGAEELDYINNDNLIEDDEEVEIQQEISNDIESIEIQSIEEKSIEVQSIEESSIGAELENNEENSRSTVTTLSLDKAVKGKLENANQVNYYKVTI